MTSSTTNGGLSRGYVQDLIISCYRDGIAVQNGTEEADAAIGVETPLIGRASSLDSLGLVTLILDIEQRLEEDHEVVLVLADERAMSQENSPFRSVATLTDYICTQIEEAGLDVGG